MDSSLAKQIGRSARAARLAAKMTQEDAAEAIGISLEFYARIERGGTLPSTPTLLALARALAVSADVLLGLDLSTSAIGRAPSVEPPAVRRLVRRISRAKPRTVRLLNLMAAALEK